MSRYPSGAMSDVIHGPDATMAGVGADAPEPAPEELRHEIVRLNEHDGPPFDQCCHCQLSRSIGSINPYEECPARERASPIDARADEARDDDEQTALGGQA